MALLNALSISSEDLTLNLAGVNVSVSPFRSNVYPENISLIEFVVLFTVIPSIIYSASEAACFCAADGAGDPIVIVGSALKSSNGASPVVILIALSAPIGDFTTNE